MPGKPFIIAIFLIIFGLGIYLNRIYAHIYEFNGVDLSKVQINRDYSLEGGRGDKKIKYVSLGDSLTYGVGVKSHNETFPYLIAEGLLDNYQGVEVYNLGVPGARTADLLNHQTGQALSLNPDLVTILIGINDVHNVTNIDDFEKDLKEVVQKLKTNKNLKIVVINIPYLGSNDLIKFPFDIYFHNKISNFNRAIYKVAESEKATYIDLFNALSSEPIQEKSYYSEDGFHPNTEGYKIWGGILKEKVR
jgi:acyl-CoA thioesterase I